MFNLETSTITTQPTPTFIFENVNKILSTFVPADSRRESNSLLMNIGVKSHGTITFSDNKSNRAEFIRIPPDAPIMCIKDLLNRQWCNERPALVISVTGGAKDYNMRPRLLRAFRRGLLKIARTTGAWIITGGMNTGIMKLVGEIVHVNPDRSRPIHLIGIGTWGCISSCQQLDVHGDNVQYTKPRSEQKGEAPLEPNHTKFIFVDDGTERKYGREIAFRARLEQAISGDFFGPRSRRNSNSYPNATGIQLSRTEQTDPVPVVLLVVEGGPNTVRTVHEAVVQNNIPAVFFEGTGRCCDLFSKAYNLYNEYRIKFELNEDTSNLDPDLVSSRYDELKTKLREDLKAQLREISGDSDKRNAKKGRKIDTTDYFELVYECINTRINFLNVVSLNSRSPVEPDIDLAILQALLKATSGNDSSKSNSQQKREQFHLALEWNRVDIAKNYIMKDERDWETVDLNDIFQLAFRRNQTEFVRLFLENDYPVTDVFRNTQILPLLYINSMKESYNATLIPADALRTIYTEIIQPLIGDFFEVEAALLPTGYSSRNRLNLDVDNEGCSCCALPSIDSSGDIEARVTRSGSCLSEASSNPPLDVDKELFVWSVITGKRDFNLLFWARGKNKICAALFAALIYRKRARKDNDNSYNKSADEFEKLAVHILDRFHQANARACTKAIIRQIPAYGNVTWLELAITAEAKEFIAQRVVQDVLNNIWFGYLDQRETHSTIIFSTIMIWYSGFLRYHDELVKTSDQISFLDELFDKSKLFQQNQTTKSKLSQQIQSRKSTVPQQMQPRKSIHSTERPLLNDVHARLIHGVTDGHDTSVAFVDVGCFEKTRTQVFRYFGNILRFARAPYVKYLYNLYFHVAFLLIFSYLMLCDFFPLYDIQLGVCAPLPHRESGTSHFNPDDVDHKSTVIPYILRKRDRPAPTEFILAVWVFTLFCEEARQFFSSEAVTLRNKIAAYLKVFWNILDVLAILLFYIGFTLRFIPVRECFCAARIVLSFDLAIWFIRLLNIFAAVKQLGPKLVMIGEMVQDLKVYVLMLLVFILGFGVSSHSLLYGAKDFNWHLPREIVQLAYWQIFGDLNALETFQEDYKANSYAVFILLIIYMATVSILLVNLLIAMFSNTFDRLQNDTDRIWKFQRYSLICEYLSRPSLPPPFMLISHVWRLILYTLVSCVRSSWLTAKYTQHTNRTQYKIILDEKSATNIEVAEDALGDEVYYNYLKLGRKLVDDNHVDNEETQSPQETVCHKIRALEDQMQLMTNQQAQVFEYLDCLMEGLKAMGGEHIRTPEQRRLELGESFDETSYNRDQLEQDSLPGPLLTDALHNTSTQSNDLQSQKTQRSPFRQTFSE